MESLGYDFVPRWAPGWAAAPGSVAAPKWKGATRPPRRRDPPRARVHGATGHPPL